MPDPQSLSRQSTVRRMAEAKAKSIYEDGLRDGVKMVLDQLGRDPAALVTEGQYTGPIPDELQEWMAGVRGRL